MRPTLTNIVNKAGGGGGEQHCASLFRRNLRFILGALIGFSVSHMSSMNNASVGLCKCETTATATTTATTTTTKKDQYKSRPLMVFPLLKELRAGWGNMKPPPLLFKQAEGTRSLIVDVGLDKGNEFFLAIQNGFEVVGFEPNPHSFLGLAGRCRSLSTTKCYAFENVSAISLPLQREPGASYLINAAVGQEPGELELFLSGPESSFQAPKTPANANRWSKVAIVKIDDFIQEDVYLFKIDAQGHDPLVLMGASNLFKDYVVRQVIWEVEPLTMMRNNVTLTKAMTMLQEYGMLCFNERADVRPDCEFWGDTVDEFEKLFFGPDNVNVAGRGLYSKCWEDFVCINIEKPYPGMALKLK